MPVIRLKLARCDLLNGGHAILALQRYCQKSKSNCNDEQELFKHLPQYDCYDLNSAKMNRNKESVLTTLEIV